MKRTIGIFSIVAVFTLSIYSCRQNNEMPLQDQYLGQDLPGENPKLFAPDLISTKAFKENGCSFSPDGREFYFSRMTENSISIYASFYEDGIWTEPDVVFSSSGFDFEPFITQDNQKLFFTRSNHSDSTFSSGIWFLNRLEEGWSSPTYFGKGMFVSSTNKGDIYYSGMLPNGWISGQIVKSEKTENTYGKPVELKGDINSDSYELHPCISDSEDYIIFVSRRTDGRDSTENYNDLYISFSENDHTWGKVKYLGDILGRSVKMSPYLSPDEKYLFYTSNDDIYWVEANFIEELRNNR
jgi:hypothetical protein